jgi:hypothetical protein
MKKIKFLKAISNSIIAVGGILSIWIIDAQDKGSIYVLIAIFIGITLLIIINELIFWRLYKKKRKSNK